ncbi:PQQ-binding-like beta-propeller repeat protein [Jiangella mangrovi]|uniref:Outer membrane protein assembly factor BamB n=1 Tax=Jiangella mangrovi TaxID=1524084 RepID=A0A7W9GQ38_9ACTN|nr:PQQ-binding-like beta-propeller repeat protein [Jiangella mangrovi]MBB5787950.1 outer membrane protein assembly factor BamB [Jiangella mangrovi]
MSTTRGRIAALLAVAAVALTACGDDSDPSASETSTDAPSEAPSDEPSTPEETGLEYACPPELRQSLPEGLDPESCWALPDLERPTMTDGTVFALEPDATDPTTARHIIALDAETGERLWKSEVLPGQVSALRATEVDGAPGVAVLVTENDAGDALTEASTAWGYLAWPADAGGDEGGNAGSEDPSFEAAVHITVPQGENPHTEVYWTDQGVLAGDFVLKPGATEFVPVNRDPEPMIVGDYDLDEFFAGVSGDLMISYVRGIAYEVSEDGDTYVGWLARTFDGAEAWNNVTSTPNEEDLLFAVGPNQMTILVGEYLLTISATDENATAFEVAWLDAATHEPATPSAADLAGVQPVIADSGNLEGTGALLSPDGRRLFTGWSNGALILDVEAGTVTPVATDFAIQGAAIDDSTVYGGTENGTLTVDLASAEATAIDPPHESFDIVDGEFGLATLDGAVGETSYVVGGRRTDAG